MLDKDKPDRDFISPANRVLMDLKQQIRLGHYALGGALPTEREMVDQFKVSRWTVRHALHALEREHLIVRQRGRGSFVVSSLYAELPVNTMVGLLGVMMWDLEYGLSGLLHGISAAATQKGYAVSTCSLHDDEEEVRSLRMFLHNSVLGVILAPRTPAARAAYYNLLAENIAVVFADARIHEVSEDHVLIDNARGASLATEHLVKLGHRQIAYLGHDDVEDWPTRPDRRRGFLEYCHGAGIDVPARHVVEVSAGAYQEPLAALLRRPDRPTAVVAYNDAWAIRLIQVARELSLSVPKDLSVVGFDDSTLAPGYDVPLTTINPERREMGVTAAALLIEKIERKTDRPKRGILIEPRLVQRQSTARIEGK